MIASLFMGKLEIGSKRPTSFRSVTSMLKAHRAEALGYGVVLVAFVASYLGVLVTRPLFVPDSQFYLGMAYWFSGLDQAAATESVKAATQAYGYGSGLSQDVLFGSGVVQPRVVLPALAIPFMWLFGMNGLAVLTGAISAVLVLVLTRILTVRYGLVSGVATVVLIASSLFIVWYSTAMLTDSLSALLGAILLAIAWRYQKSTSRFLLVTLVLVTVVAGFTRQSTLIPAGAFAVAWLMSVLLRPRVRGWGLPALAVCLTTVVVQAAQSVIFAPVKLDDSRVASAQPTGFLETAVHLVDRTIYILKAEASSFAHFDHALLVFIGLSILSMMVFWRRPESHLLAGALIGLAIYNVGNGTSTSFRYAIPGLVFYAASVALLFNGMVMKASHLVGAGRQPRTTPPSSEG